MKILLDTKTETVIDVLKQLCENNDCLSFKVLDAGRISVFQSGDNSFIIHLLKSRNNDWCVYFFGGGNELQSNRFVSKFRNIIIESKIDKIFRYRSYEDEDFSGEI